VDINYVFAHDRVHEATYGMLPEFERAETHRRIGFRLLEALNDAEIDAQIFEIVSQVNRGGIAHSDLAERTTAASLNLRAGRKAKASAAYAAACGYLAEGRKLLGQNGLKSHYKLAFSLALEHAECTFLSGQLDDAEKIIASLLDHAATNVDRAAVYRLKIEVHVVKSENLDAIASGLAGLRLFGINVSPHPSRKEVKREYDTIWTNLGGRSIESLADVPAMTDPDMQAATRILAELIAPAYFTDFNLMALLICQMVNVNLVYGAANASNQGYAWLGWLMGPAFGRYQDGYRIGKFACELISERNVLLDMARVNHTMGLTSSWTQPLTTSIDWFRSAYRIGIEAGDLYFACYSSAHIAVSLLLRGHNLQQDADECREYLDFARGLGFRDGVDLIVTSERTMASLRGLTRDLSDFSEAGFDETAFESELTEARMNIVVYWYWTRKLMLHFLSGDYKAALVAADKARPQRWIKIVQIQHLDYHYYTALTLAARIEEAATEQREALRSRLAVHYEQLRTWVEETRSPTFADKHALVSAEIARLEDRQSDAMRLYEEAIRLARENGFVQNEGLAYELAARFYAACGFEQFANLYLHNARACYLRWGADGKVRQLDAIYPHLRPEEPVPASTSTMAAPVERLELATVTKVSQAVAGEIVLEKLLDTLMRTALEQAGAERGLLILSRGAEQHVAGEATTRGDQVSVHLRDEPVSPDQLPASVLHYVMRTRESVILDDAAHSPFAADAYIRQRQARSVLCLPLLNQAKVIGVLYLENNLAPRVFVPARLAVLKLLASQAAIALENARLYQDLAEREAKIRRLVDADVIGIFIWDLDGRLLDANDAFLRMVQYTREDLSAGLRWFDMTPPEWQEAHVREEADELRSTGMMKAREKEFFRKDGSRVPVLIGAACFDEPPDQGVAYILDLTERKRMEAEARESERRYREVQMELAHANRVTTMGELTGSIAHEVNQPIASAFTNAQAGLRWLGRQPPDLDEVRQAFDRIVENAGRAGEVVQRIRALIKKAPPQLEVLAINDAVGEVIELTRSEAMKNRVTVTAGLADGLPLIRGDRVQLQQVMLNLILNAIEAMSGVCDGAREVLIRTEQDAAGAVLVTVRDTGPGLDPQGIEQVFETFYTTKPSGMGMGLSICRSIIAAHSGRLWASANVPQGAMFQFTLPPWDGTVAKEFGEPKASPEGHLEHRSRPRQVN
jgi:PAS domain S-box-containing protein